MPRYKIQFKRELELSVEVEASTEHRAELAAETQLASIHPSEWEEIDTTIENVECLDEDEDLDDEESDDEEADDE